MPGRTADTGQPKPAGWAPLTALGIVYGDLGTSPLYTLRTVAQANGGHFSAATALGVLSLIVWTLILIVSVKYCVLVMNADNHGEGGILALMSLVGGNSLARGARLVTVLGLLGAALIYGDGIITPAISVLSALEGINVVSSALKPAILPLAVGILIVLFAVQRFGTQNIGKAFGPTMLLWFVVIGLIGAMGVVRHPIVLTALDPGQGIAFLLNSGTASPLILGGVFLCVTGAEALYADMGHIGKAPIRNSWYFIVLPALLLSYAGQTGLLLDGGSSGNPFFQLAPSWSICPLVILATVATIIASQAIITGAFSMTRQAMQLGWLPGVHIKQTSSEVYGQIYVPTVNWLMMIATVGITLAFQSSDRLAGAYGTAVSTTMLLTTCLLFTAMRKVWGWSGIAAGSVAGVFLIIDLAFFCSNLLKIADGGWVPLTLGAAIFFVMTTWRSGIDCVKAALAHNADAIVGFIEDLKAGAIPRVPGTAVFLTRSSQRISPLVLDHVKHMGSLHQHVIALTVAFEEVPRVTESRRCEGEVIGPGFLRATARFGFVEIPDLSDALKGLASLDANLDIDSAVYFGTRDFVVRKLDVPLLSRWRLPVFAFLYRNAVKMVDRFKLPADQVVEIARQIEV